jgi:hypothetical protein
MNPPNPPENKPFTGSYLGIANYIGEEPSVDGLTEALSKRLPEPKQSNNAVKDPKKVVRAECEALLIELELAKTRISRLEDALEQVTVYDRDVREVNRVVYHYKDLMTALDYICADAQLEADIEASKDSKSSPVPKMERA